MSDQETKKQRRDQAREARRVAEAEAAAAAAKARVRSIGITIVSVAAIAGLVWLAIDNNRTVDLEGAILVNAAQAETGLAAAGCEVLAADAPLDDRTHYDPATAPPADVLYPGVRPTHSGPHFSSTHPILRAGSSQQIEERAVTHSLEHGSIGFFYNPDLLDSAAISELESLGEALNDNGFAVARAGAGIYVAPYTEPGITSGKAVAMRAWGQAVDCDGVDPDVIQAFVIEHYGTHGIAPEGNFAPYPEAVLRYDEDSEQAVDEDSPQSQDPADDATDGDLGDMAPSDEAPSDEAPASDAASEPAPADEASTVPSESPSEG